MRFSFKFLLLFAALTIFSCSRKEDPIGTSEVPLSITLESDAGSGEMEVIPQHSIVVFTVKGSDGNDYTDESEILVNGERIAGSTYVFDETGRFSVQAKLGDLTSNIINFDILEPTQRVLKLSAVQALRNQVITFSLLDDQGNDTSDEATFYVDGRAISGNTFSSANPGEFEVYATYEVNDESYTTETQDFEVFIPKRKVVVEDYTGTWCGFCPAVALAVDELRALTPHVAVVAIHKSASSIPDPLHFDRIQELQDMFNIDNAFPKAQINRTTPWPRPYDMSLPMRMAGTNSDVSISIKSQLSGDRLTARVNVIYENGSTSGDKVVVYLLENGVISPQANYYNETPGHPYQGLGNPIMDYEHNDGLRHSLSDLFGDPIPNTPAFEVFTREYSFTVPPHYVGENLSFVVMVVDSENTAKNAQFSKINEDKKFE